MFVSGRADSYSISSKKKFLFYFFSAINLFIWIEKSIIMIILKSFTMINLLSLIQFYVIGEWSWDLISKNAIDFWSQSMLTQKRCNRFFSDYKDKQTERERAISNDSETYLTALRTSCQVDSLLRCKQWLIQRSKYIADESNPNEHNVSKREWQFANERNGTIMNMSISPLEGISVAFSWFKTRILDLQYLSFYSYLHLILISHIYELSQKP